MKKTTLKLQLHLKKAATVLAIGVIGFTIFGLAPPKTQAAAGINQQLNFQGRLLSNTGAVVADGGYNMEFKIYQDGNGCVGGGSSPCSGTLKWTEDWLVNNTQGVTIKNGYFSANLGSITAFANNIDWNQDTLWLSINIGGTANTPTPTYDGEMLPFKRLTSTPYALNSNSLQGLQAASFVQLAQGVQADSSTSNSSIFINKTGSTASILELQKSGTDVLNLNNSGQLALQPAVDGNALQVKTHGSKEILTVDTSGSQVLLGKTGSSGVNGSLVFNTTNASNTAITISAASTGTSYSLTLPTTGPSTSQCLQSDPSTASQLIFSTCGGGLTTVSYSSSQNANGGSISGVTLTLYKADGSNPGLVSTDAQTFGGAKTFNSAIAAPISTNTINGLIVNSGALSGITTFSQSQNVNTNDIFALSNTGLTTTGNDLANLTFKNNNSSGSSTINGLTITEQAANAGGTNTSNLLNLGAAANGTVNGINFGSNFTNYFTNAAGTTKLDSSGALTLAGGLTCTNCVSNSDLRQSGSTSVIGRSANSTGNVADIQASADNQVLFRSGGALTFGTLPNGALSSSSITVSAGTSGTDFNISGGGPVALGGTVTLNLPDANGTTARGVVSTGTQTFGGAKTFSSGLTINTNSSTAFSITNGATSGLAFDDTSGNNKLIIYDPSSSSNHLDLYYDHATSSGIIAANSGTTQLGVAAAGAITIGNGSTTSVNITGGSASVWQINSAALTLTAGAASTWSTSSGGLTLTSAAAATWSTAAGGLTLTSAAAATWSTTAGNLTVQAGSGTISLGSTTLVNNTGANLTISSNGGSDLYLNSTAILRPGTDGATGLQFQNAAATTTALDIDTTNSRVGIGVNITAPRDTLEVGGNAIIGAQADSSPSLAPGSFSTTNTSSTAGNFNGDTNRDGAYSSVVYKGKLYVSTKENDASSVYRYDGSNVWTKVSDAAGKIISGDAAAIDYSILSVFNGKLYAATVNSLGATTCTTSANCGAVYSYDGTTWTMVNSARGTFGGTTLVFGSTDIQVCNNRMYVAVIGTVATNTAQIFRYDGGTTFTAITFAAGKFIVTGETAQVDGYSMVCFGGNLIAGTLTGSGTNTARVARWDGNAWKQLNNPTNGTGGTFGAQTLIDDVDSMTVFGGQLYVGVGEPNLAAIYVYKPSLTTPATVGTGTDFQLVTSTSGRIDAASDATDIDGIPVLRQYNGRLYAGSDTSAAGNKAGVYEFDPTALSWTIMNSAAGAPAANRGSFGSETNVDKVDRITELNGTLYVGTEDSASNDGSIYTWTKTSSNSYALKFDGGSSNYGSISFTSNLQAGDNNGHTGSFLFSNPVNLGGGAFDYAEDYPTFDNSLVPGQPVAVDPASPDHVRLAVAGDSILGVVSENPGMRLSTTVPLAGGDRYIAIALVGRVPAEVTTAGGTHPIKAGDKLGLSSTAGVLAKVTGPGNVVGTALASYDSADNGTVDVFVNPGWDGNFISLGQIGSQDSSGISINLGDSQIFRLLDKNGQNVFSVDSQGNASFAGTVTADKIKANQIEGIEILTDKISSLSARLAKDKSTATAGANPGLLASSLSGSSINFDDIQASNLIVLTQAEFKGGLRVDQDAHFNGKTIFELLAEFNGPVKFNGQVSFNNDAGGTAIIHKDAQKLSIKFSKQYAQAPIVVGNWLFSDSKDSDGNITDSSDAKLQRVLDGGYSFSVANVTPKGFDIILNKKASEDLQLSWLATAINGAKISESASTQ